MDGLRSTLACNRIAARPGACLRNSLPPAALQDIEKLGAKRGVVLQSVKEVLQVLGRLGGRSGQGS